MKICPTCDREYPEDENFCHRDGTSLRLQNRDDSLVGSVIAERYHVLRKLGEGGMGQVYLAEHVRMRRKSAVKVMHAGMMHDADAISRFNREATNACQIVHPNVVDIYDFGETADAVTYLAMEYVEGDSLSAVLANVGALPVARAADITRQIASGLASAHALGIVHRDLKPDNILIAKNHDGRDLVKVVDFGISKAVQQEGQKVTRTGMVIGTPEFMSPEQLSGDPIDARSDTYSLAIVAFNMLTGKLPFPSDSAQTSMIMRLTERPKRLAEMHPDVVWPANVQEVMDRALERDVDRRYQTATDFGAALTSVLERMPRSSLTSAGTLMFDPSAQATVVKPPPAPAATLSSSSPPAETTASGPPSGISAAELSSIEAQLARVIGPVASVFVKRAARTAATRGALLAALESEIDDPSEREIFRKACLTLKR